MAKLGRYWKSFNGLLWQRATSWDLKNRRYFLEITPNGDKNGGNILVFWCRWTEFGKVKSWKWSDAPQSPEQFTILQNIAHHVLQLDVFWAALTTLGHWDTGWEASEKKGFFLFLAQTAIWPSWTWLLYWLWHWPGFERSTLWLQLHL